MSNYTRPEEVLALENLIVYADGVISVVDPDAEFSIGCIRKPDSLTLYKVLKKIHEVQGPDE